MDSDNPSGADNQQERLWHQGWVVGFVDGEGCFSCQIHRNKSMTQGWQVQPRFAVVQGASSRVVLDELASFFGCGKVLWNRRRDNHREDLCVFYVQRHCDLRDVIIPYFWRNPLQTAKKENFEKFAEVINLIGHREHLTRDGLVRIAEIAQTMNHRKPSEVLRILRDHTPTNLDHISS